MVMGLVSRLSGANPSDSGSLLMAHTLLNHDGFQQEGFWEVGRTYGLASVFCLLLIFLNSSGWWSLVSSEFLLRTSCCKITHANGYYLAWPGWRFQSVFPLTGLPDVCYDTIRVTIYLAYMICYLTACCPKC